MKKRLIAAALAVITVLFCVMSALTSCGDGNTVTLYVYNWGEYISDGSEGSLDVNKEFEKYCSENEKIKALTGGKNVKVKYSTFSSNEDLYAKLSSKTASYDIVIPSDYMIERLIKEGLLQKIDVSKMENFKNIDERFVNPVYDEKNEYSVPYTYGTVGIIYDTTKVDEKDVADQSWGLMWNEKYKGEILQFNNPRDAFATAQFYQGIDPNSEKEEDWRKAQEYLKKQKDIVQGYVMDEVFNKMQSSSAAVAVYYAGDFLTMYEKNDKLAFYYPKEGTNLFVDAMCVPANAKNPELAAEYINFMLSEGIAIANAEAIYYASPNKLVYENADYQEELGEEAMEILYGYEDVYGEEGIENKKLGIFRNLPDGTQKLMSSLWEELKIESGNKAMIYIIFIILLAAAALIIVIFIIKKKKKAVSY